MQPLDVAVYRALKIFFEQEISAFQKQRIIKQHDIAKLLTPAYEKAASAQNAVSGFKTPGIWPYNPSVFGDEDFVPASIMGTMEMLLYLQAYKKLLCMKQTRHGRCHHLKQTQ